MSHRPKPSRQASPDTEAPSASSGDSHFATRLTLRLDELAETLGVSRRTIERERSAGRFPAPDLHLGRAPLWRPETIRRWIDGGGR
jgi:predicted DNA-binding transcriptional regulator AlpA